MDEVFVLGTIVQVREGQPVLAPCQVMGYVFAKTVVLKRIWILLTLDIESFSS